MKTIGVVTALCLLTFSCKNETPANQTTADASSTAAAVSAAGTTETTARTLATELTVTFTGMITFVIPDDVVQRAVVVRAPLHPMKIRFPLSMETPLKAKLKTTCGSIDCSVDFDNVSFQIVDQKGDLLKAPFHPSKPFTDSVTSLQSVHLPISEKDAFDSRNINSDILAKPMKSSVIGGFFDLHGGEGDAIPFHCTAHFGTDTSTTQAFANVAIVKFALSTGAKLQASEDGGAWVDIVDLTSLSGPLKFTVDNNKGGMVSHFDNYAMLSTKTVHLPPVVKDVQTCEGGDVPGCSDSRWP